MAGGMNRRAGKWLVLAAPRSVLRLALGFGVALGWAVANPHAQAGNAPAREALAAVATNFAEAAAALETRFEAQSGHRLRVATGSTGKLYAQIRAGAPFDLFLAADADRPRRLVEDGRAIEGTRFPYAMGQLVLWSPDSARIAHGPAALAANDFRVLALANPDLAPYGAAAQETIAALGLTEALRNRIVLGENIGQVFALIDTGNAPLGFVARSQLLARADGSRWDVPGDLHQPIFQEAVLLARGAENPAAIGFLAFLQSPPAKRLIAQFGYEVP